MEDAKDAPGTRGQCSVMFNGVDLQGFDINRTDVPETADKNECCDLCRQNKGVLRIWFQCNRRNSVEIMLVFTDRGGK